MKSLSRVWLFATPWTVDHWAPPVHGILQARILEWVAISFSSRSSWLRDRTLVSCIAGRCFNLWATRKALLGEKKDIKNQCEPIKRRAFLADLIYNGSQLGLVCLQEIYVNIWTYLWLLRLRESMVLASNVQRTEMSVNILQFTGKLHSAWNHVA